MKWLLSRNSWSRTAHRRESRSRRLAPAVLAFWSVTVLGAALQPCVAEVQAPHPARHASQWHEVSHADSSSEKNAVERDRGFAAHDSSSGPASDSPSVPGTHCVELLDTAIVQADAKPLAALHSRDFKAAPIAVSYFRLSAPIVWPLGVMPDYGAAVHPPDILRRTARLLI